MYDVRQSGQVNQQTSEYWYFLGVESFNNKNASVLMVFQCAVNLVGCMSRRKIFFVAISKQRSSLFRIQGFCMLIPGKINRDLHTQIGISLKQILEILSMFILVNSVHVFSFCLTRGPISTTLTNLPTSHNLFLTIVKH